jgi:hypothetical protein
LIAGKKEETEEKRQSERGDSQRLGHCEWRVRFAKREKWTVSGEEEKGRQEAQFCQKNREWREKEVDVDVDVRKVEVVLRVVKSKSGKRGERADGVWDWDWKTGEGVRVKSAVATRVVGRSRQHHPGVRKEWLGESKGREKRRGRSEGEAWRRRAATKKRREKEEKNERQGQCSPLFSSGCRGAQSRRGSGKRRK